MAVQERPATGVGSQAVPPAAPVRPRSAWARRYSAVLHALEILTATLVAGALVLGSTPPDVGGLLPLAAPALVVAWPLLLSVLGAHSEKVFGAGSDEYRLVGRAGLVLLSVTAFISAAAARDLPRELVVVAVPALVLLTLLLRFGCRQQLHRLRVRGRCVKRVVLVGRGGAVLDLAARFQGSTHMGLQVVGACVTPEDRSRVASALGVQVGGLEDVVTVAAWEAADTVAVTSASETAAEYLRRLSWQMEGTGLELLVAPGLIEVAGPRLHIRPFEGLPLLAVEEPRFESWPRVVKAALDRTVAVAALVVLAPVLLGIALAVRASSDGPALYRQVRIGMHGQPFTMLKFRSMVVDADRLLDDVRSHNLGDGLLFKARNDPRVTPVGRWLRRLSLDELPQLLNVLGGTMSLVGPRPPLPSEVEQYDTSVRRRLLVKPGLTGLWQISGRSDLPWEEAVRLDLRYVENWSLAADLMILWKTARAVAQSRGAY